MWPLHQRNQTKSTGQVNSINAVSLHSKKYVYVTSAEELNAGNEVATAPFAGTVSRQCLMLRPVPMNNQALQQYTGDLLSHLSAASVVASRGRQ